MTPAETVDTSAETAAPAPDLSWVGEEFRGESGINLDTFRPHYEQLLADQARRTETAVTPPEKYDFAIPDGLSFDGLTLPADYKPVIATDDPDLAPMFDELGATLKEFGLPQDAAGKMMGLLAKYEAVQQSKITAAQKAEMQKLGSTQQQIDARLSTLKRAIEANLPTDQAKALIEGTRSLNAVRALEALFAPKGGPTPVPQPTPVDPLAARYPNSRKE